MTHSFKVLLPDFTTIDSICQSILSETEMRTQSGPAWEACCLFCSNKKHLPHLPHLVVSSLIIHRLLLSYPYIFLLLQNPQDFQTEVYIGKMGHGIFSVTSLSSDAGTKPKLQQHRPQNRHQQQHNSRRVFKLLGSLTYVRECVS